MNLLPLVRRVFGAEQIAGALITGLVWEMPEAFDVERGWAA